MARYRSMRLTPQSGEWEEIGDEEELEVRYAASRGGWAATKEVMLGNRELYVEVWRNGGWRAASYREVPLAQRTRELEIDRLAGQAEDIRSRAAAKLERCRAAVGPGEEAVKAAKAALEAAQAAILASEKDTEAAEKTARKVERDRAGKVEELDAMLRRQDGAGAEIATAVNV